jgi:hypothetical protein
MTRNSKGGTVPEEKLAQLVLLVAGEVGDDQAHLVIHHHHPQPEHLNKKANK